MTEGPRIVRIKVLDVDVRLEATEAVAIQRLVHHVEIIRVVGMERPQRNSLGEVAALLGKPAVQLTGHPRTMGVGEETEALHSVRPKTFHHLFGIRGMGKHPPAFGKPSVNRRKEPRRVQMGVKIKDRTLPGC